MINTRMLSRDEETPDDVEVTRADQNKINRFSTLHRKQATLKELLDEKNQEKEYLSDATMELELADEDELVPYKIGDAFVHISASEAQELLSKAQEKLDEEISAFEGKMEHNTEEMEELKVHLYAKFGKAINLEV